MSHRTSSSRFPSLFSSRPAVTARQWRGAASLACVAVLGVIAAAQASAQGTESASVAGTQVNLVLPAGYCKITRESEFGKSFYGLQERVQANLNQVLLGYANCDELAKVAAHKLQAPPHYGMYLAPLNGGRVNKIPSGYTRPRVLDEIAKSVPAIDMNKIQSDASARISGAGGQMSGMTSGLLGKDESAVYLGVAGNNGSGAHATRFRGVVAMTQLKDVVVSNNLYGPVETSGGGFFDPLMNAQKPHMAALIKAN